jgi:hypothetical protein
MVTPTRSCTCTAKKMASKFRASRLAAAVIASALLVGLSACFYSPVTGQSDRTLNDILKNLPAEYESTHPEGGDCGIDHCDFNKRITLSALSNASVPNECKKLIEWSASIGAATWYHDSDYLAFPLKGYESQAIIACTMVQMSESPMSGDGTSIITKNFLGESSTAMFGLRGIYPGNDLKSPFDIQFNSNRQSRSRASDPITRKWGVSVSTTYGDQDTRFNAATAPSWEEAFRSLPDDSKQLDQILDAVGHYRFTHPQADPYAASTITRALAGLPGTTKYSLSKFADGSVHFVFVTSANDFMNKDGGLCLSLKKFDPQQFNVADPGTGYTHFVINSFEQFNAFGSWVPGKCPTK